MWQAIMNEACKTVPMTAFNSMTLGDKRFGNSKALVTLMPDGLHLNAAGYRIFTKEIDSAIKQKWPEWTSEKLSNHFIFPHWTTAPRLAQ